MCVSKLVTAGTQHGGQMSWNPWSWSYRQLAMSLLMLMSMLGTKLRSTSPSHFSRPSLQILRFIFSSKFHSIFKKRSDLSELETQCIMISHIGEKKQGEKVCVL